MDVTVAWQIDGPRAPDIVQMVGTSTEEVKDKLKDLHAELDAGIRTRHGYTVESAVADWLAGGLPGRTAKTTFPALTSSVSKGRRSLPSKRLPSA